jgi:hypothetical protein
MVDWTQYGGRLTPPEVRQMSLWAVFGVALALVIGPLLAPHWRLVSSLIQIVGSTITVWKLMRISLSAPGWNSVSPGQFDEREKAERHQVMAISYVILSFLLILIVLLWDREFMRPVVAFFSTHMPLGYRGTLIFVPTAIPAIILAWRSKRIEQAIEDEA